MFLFTIVIAMSGNMAPHICNNMRIIQCMGFNLTMKYIVLRIAEEINVIIWFTSQFPRYASRHVNSCIIQPIRITYQVAKFSIGHFQHQKRIRFMHYMVLCIFQQCQRLVWDIFLLFPGCFINKVSTFKGLDNHICICSFIQTSIDKMMTSLCMNNIGNDFQLFFSTFQH